MRSNTAVILIGLLLGCEALPAWAGSRPRARDLSPAEEAMRYLEAGDYSRAKRIVAGLLEPGRGDSNAELLMARILDAEIAEQQNARGAYAVEELSDEERLEEAGRWVGRGRALHKLGREEEALLAAERAFLYDADSQEASRLADEIKKGIRDAGHDESLILKHVYEDQIQDRTAYYRKQAAEWVEEGRWGAARFAVEKILLLSPGDPEALRLHREMESRRKSKPK